jgi:adenylate cyclase
MGMDARLEGKLRLLAIIVAGGAIAGLAFSRQQGSSIPGNMGYAMLMSGVLGAMELFVLGGPLRAWLSAMSFTRNLVIRSAFYVLIIAALQWLQFNDFAVGMPAEASIRTFWYGFVYSVVLSILFNLVFSITNLIGGRAFVNFLTGRYHTPVEENRFVLFVDIAGSTGLAEQLGGVGIHRFLDLPFACSPSRSWTIAARC